MSIAIVAIAYNRVNSLNRLLKSLNDAYYPSDDIPLIISIDKSNTDEVERFADDFLWKHGPKKVKKHDKNLGLKKHILEQGQELDNFDAIIILEDDVIVSPAFYCYALQSVKKYASNTDIAGISLYSFPLNNYTNYPFCALKDSNDVFFMNIAQSWGEIWMKKSWLSFYEWFLNNESFEPSDRIPAQLFNWKQSWLKYHNRYCSEKNKYFVYPYHSFSSNCGDLGIHAQKCYNTFQTSMQLSVEGDMKFPNSPEYGICYDCFFENKALYKVLGLSESTCCLDLNCYRTPTNNQRYWLTLKKEPYAVIKSYGLKYKPIEMNVIMGLPGSDIYLYDLSQTASPPSSSFPFGYILYMYRINDLFNLIRRYGFNAIARELKEKIIRKIKLWKI